MVRTVLYAFYFWFLFMLTLLLLIPYGFFRLFRLSRAEEAFITFWATVWSRHILWTAGARVKVIGTENIPRDGKLCFVSNHQSIADIPLVFGYTGKRIGIIAKKELAMVPIVNIWIRALGCILIDRKNPRKAIDAIDRGIENIRNGRHMAIFPEGTRSRGPVMNPFKPGSLKLATRSGATVVPISISGSYKLLEEHGRVTPAHVDFVVHAPIPTEGMSQEEVRELPGRIEAIVKGGLTVPADRQTGDSGPRP